MRTIESREETLRKSFVRILLTSPYAKIKELKKIIKDEERYIKKNGKSYELKFIRAFLEYLNECEKEKKNV